MLICILLNSAVMQEFIGILCSLPKMHDMTNHESCIASLYYDGTRTWKPSPGMLENLDYGVGSFPWLSSSGCHGSLSPLL